MKEFVTIAVAFLVVVILALFMYISNQKNTISRVENGEIKKLVIQNNKDLKKEIEELRNHVHLMDSLYHK